ncbi:DNA gyrase subunit A [Fructilactobacillus lindneri]|nr:DNA gyrase subunit A [Fructilactobacillus lindneri]ANZ57543.1 DNA gyrase subunit A [Fructilactobacillus lindneri]POG97696.1 DNA gyrase subunit A [Fructilactobacillus lindneri]POH05913.1 DNA gyrase subunit A [Fructilactobacillus lindneri]POH06103.1 DNA gyrase subunit A [Fructilactobacillus lindneri]POH06755.1 DNA gyrase subunit A [Fructilactobacillus lindneri]
MNGGSHLANETDTPETRITNVDLSKKMKSSFLDYAMSVIVARALPDVRDGMKPVNRRILYGMDQLGVTPEKPYKKSARIVGDVMGKYHPHGDSSIYEAMVRMAQEFSYRYMLVDGHGNFGSVDGDGAAAMRYTEARLSKISMEMLRDLNKNTVNFVPNYDGTEREPVVLPARIPNLLLNGATGIAVGMATNIPPHNLSEVISAIHILMKNPDATVNDLMEALPGPDFPTGGIVMGKSGIRNAYETGRGNIIVRAKVDIETDKNGKQTIIATELPYMVNKAKLIERIADLVRDKRIVGITAINDESDREGMRIAIDVRRDANAEVVLNNLYKMTLMQTSYSFNMLAIIDGAPKVLGLKEILNSYLNYQIDVITRRTKFNLKKAEARAHILVGLLVALDNIDAVIKIIRGSKTGEIAKNELINNFELDDKQAQAILDMRLVRLTGLERGKITDEHEKLMEQIKDYRDILNSHERVTEIIYDELMDIQKRFGDERRTQLMIGEITNIEDEDLIEDEHVTITLTHNGYIKRLPTDEFKTQNRGGRGIKGMGVNKDDFIEHLLTGSTHDLLLFFTNSGKVYSMKAYEVPEYGRSAKGIPIVNLIHLGDNEKIQTVLDISADGNNDDKYLFFTTKLGTVKRTPLNEFVNIRNNGLKSINLRDQDEVINVSLVDDNQNMIIGTHLGYAVSFKVNDVRTMGRSATGVRGVRLRPDDYVIGAAILAPDSDVFVISEKGYGKRTPADQYAIKGRGGKGIKTSNISEKNGPLVGLGVINQDEDIMLITDQGVMIRFAAGNVSETGRATLGVHLIRVDDGSKVATMAIVQRTEPEKNIDDADENPNDDPEN